MEIMLKHQIYSFLGLGVKPLLKGVAFVLGLSFAIMELITNYIWNPAALYITISAMVAIDTATGIVRALRRKDEQGYSAFETRRALDGFFKWLGYTVVLAITNQLVKHDEYLVMLREVVFIPIVLILFASVIKNLTLLGWLDNSIGKWIYKNIDAYKNEKMKPKE